MLLQFFCAWHGYPTSNHLFNYFLKENNGVDFIYSIYGLFFLERVDGRRLEQRARQRSELMTTLYLFIFEIGI
jgi:hypothetical protein